MRIAPEKLVYVGGRVFPSARKPSSDGWQPSFGRGLREIGGDGLAHEGSHADVPSARGAFEISERSGIEKQTRTVHIYIYYQHICRTTTAVTVARRRRAVLGSL
jgi:hypothetical protein